MISLPRTVGLRVRVSRESFDRSFTEQATPHLKIGRQFNAPEVAAIDVRDAIVLCQAFVHKGVIGIQQIDYAAVFVHDAADEEVHLLQHRRPKIVVEVRIQRCRRLHGLQRTQHEPLGCKIGDQRVSLGIGEHPANLFGQNGRLMKLVLARGGNQFVVGNAAPEEK